MNTSRKNLRQSGFSMIEVLVTLIILLIGLLGLAGLMVQGQRSEMESYQRVQALVLLRDIAGRINANRNVASCYAFTTNVANGTPFLGTTGTGVLTAIPLAPSCVTGTIAPTPAQQAQFNTDLTAWNTLLLGAAESTGGSNTGAMIGARGCISYDATSELPALNGTIVPGTGIYTVSVAWQGMGDTFANTSLLCGTGLYLNNQGVADEALRRVANITFRIGSVGNTN